MKLTAFDQAFASRVATGSTTLGFSSGSNSALGDLAGGNDVVGHPGDYTVVGLRDQVSLGSNMGDNTVGSVLTTISSSPWIAKFAISSNTSVGSNFLLRTEGGQDTIMAHGSAGATEDIDPDSGNVHTLTLNANLTASIRQPAGSGAATIELWVTQDGTGGWTLTLTADGGSVTGDISAHTTTAGETFRVIAERVPGTTNDWVIDLVGGSGASALTVEDEGTPLATAASTLDFVGAGVVATGAGAEKTITIAGYSEAVVYATGHYEVLMDGGSPPEPLEDGSGTDWLYVWVPG